MIQKYEFNKNIKLDENIACIGYFDGVHRGHQQLLKKTIEIARKKNLKAFVITFYPDPYEVIHKTKNKQINTLKERIKLFEKFGMDGVIILPFNDKMMKLDINEFKKQILDKLNINTLVCGYDFTYGYKGSGNVKTLLKQGFNLEVIEEFTYYGKKISSTRIRKEIDNKNFKLVNKLLGYEYK